MLNVHLLLADLKSLEQVVGDVVGVLQADREPDESVSHAQADALLLLDGGVGHEVGELRQGLIAAEGLGEGNQLQVVRCVLTSLSFDIILQPACGPYTKIEECYFGQKRGILAIFSAKKENFFQAIFHLFLDHFGHFFTFIVLYRLN